MPPEVNSSPTAAVQLCSHERARRAGDAILVRLQVTDGVASRSLILRGSVPRMRLLAESILGTGISAPAEKIGTGANLLAQLEADAAVVPAKGAPAACDKDRGWESIRALRVIGPLRPGRTISDADLSVMREAWAIHQRTPSLPRNRTAIYLGVSDETLRRYFAQFSREEAAASARPPHLKPNGRLL